jgi:hypothetical protein
VTSFFRVLTRFHSRPKGWVLGENGDEIHVLPVSDLIEHLADDCACGTTTEPCPRDDGSMRWLITHYSLDGRERTETT